MTQNPLRKNQAGQPSKNGGEFASAPARAEATFALSNPRTDIVVYEYQGGFFTAETLAKRMKLHGADLDAFLASSEYGDGVNQPKFFTEQLLPLPGEDGKELYDIEKELVDDDLRNVHARVDDETGDIVVTATYYENLLWDDDFEADELDAAAPVVEDFLTKRFGVEVTDLSLGWESLPLEFEARFRPEEFAPTLVANGFDDRSDFVKFRNERDPGTFMSPYAYSDLRTAIDNAVVVPNRWAALSDAKTVDAEFIADALPAGAVPADAEALAIAGSIHDGGYLGVGDKELRSLADSGWAYDVENIRQAAERILDDDTAEAFHNRAATLLAWLDKD